MNNIHKAQLLHTVVSGTGMVQPHVPSVVLGNIKNGYAKGDLMDANAVIELIDKSHEEGEYMTRSDV